MSDAPPPPLPNGLPPWAGEPTLQELQAESMRRADSVRGADAASKLAFLDLCGALLAVVSVIGAVSGWLADRQDDWISVAAKGGGLLSLAAAAMLLGAAGYRLAVAAEYARHSVVRHLLLGLAGAMLLAAGQVAFGFGMAHHAELSAWAVRRSPWWTGCTGVALVPFVLALGHAWIAVLHGRALRDHHGQPLDS